MPSQSKRRNPGSVDGAHQSKTNLKNQNNAGALEGGPTFGYEAGWGATGSTGTRNSWCWREVIHHNTTVKWANVSLITSIVLLSACESSCKDSSQQLFTVSSFITLILPPVSIQTDCCCRANRMMEIRLIKTYCWPVFLLPCCGLMGKKYQILPSKLCIFCVLINHKGCLLNSNYRTHDIITCKKDNVHLSCPNCYWFPTPVHRI